jgi:hypothetical protein
MKSFPGVSSSHAELYMGREIKYRHGDLPRMAVFKKKKVLNACLVTIFILFNVDNITQCSKSL